MNGTLEQVGAAVAMAVVLFVATNIDDIFILLALFANPNLRASQIVVGQLIGMAAIIGLSVAGALLAFLVAPKYVGLLGIVPLGLGIAQLVRRNKGDDDDDADTSSGNLRVFAVVALTVANGADNLGVYIPVFANASRMELVVCTTTMLVLTAALCWLAHVLVNHPTLGGPIRRYVQPMTPYILIALGAYILLKDLL